MTKGPQFASGHHPPPPDGYPGHRRNVADRGVRWLVGGFVAVATIIGIGAAIWHFLGA